MQKKETHVQAKKSLSDYIIISQNSRGRGIFTIIIIFVAVYSTFTCVFLYRLWLLTTL